MKAIMLIDASTMRVKGVINRNVDPFEQEELSDRKWSKVANLYKWLQNVLAKHSQRPHDSLVDGRAKKSSITIVWVPLSPNFGWRGTPGCSKSFETATYSFSEFFLLASSRTQIIFLLVLSSFLYLLDVLYFQLLLPLSKVLELVNRLNSISNFNNSLKRWWYSINFHDKWTLDLDSFQEIFKYTYWMVIHFYHLSHWVEIEKNDDPIL